MQKVKVAYDEGKFTDAVKLWKSSQWDVREFGYDVSFYNVLYERAYFSDNDVITTTKLQLAKQTLENLMRNDVKTALNISANVTWSSQKFKVFETLTEDFMKPVTSEVEKLLNTTAVKVVVYSGILDLICATPGTVKWVNNLNWHGRSKYLKAERKPFGVDKIFEGFSRSFDNFTMYWVSFYDQICESYFFYYFFSYAD